MKYAQTKFQLIGTFHISAELHLHKIGRDLDSHTNQLIINHENINELIAGLEPIPDLSDELEVSNFTNAPPESIFLKMEEKWLMYKQSGKEAQNYQKAR